MGIIRKPKKSLNRFTPLLPCVGLLMAGQVCAQLEEVVVTATKREANIMDVPVSITAFGQQELQNRTATRLTDVTFGAANVSLEQNVDIGSSASFSIRGLSTTLNNTGVTPGVGLYIDGVYVGRNIAFDSSLADVERVEILRGPQGTLFGRNTIQGAINVVTERPAADTPTTLNFQVGNDSLMQIRGSTGGELSPGFFGKISAYSRERDGYVNNSGVGGKLNGEDYYGGKAQLLYDPQEELRVFVSMDYQEDDTSANTRSTDGVSYTVATNGLPGGGREFFEREIFGASIQVDYDFSNMTLTSITGFRTFDSTFANDQDFSPLLFNLIARRDEKADQWTQELRLASTGDGGLEWLVGAYFFDQQGDTRSFAQFGQDAGPLNGLTLDALAELDVISYAAFADVGFRLAEGLSLNIGLRWTTEEQDLAFNQDSVAPSFRFNILNDREDDDPSASISLNYKWNEDLRTYVKYARGFKSGGFNTTFALAPGQITTFEPETLDSYEIGAKARFFDDRLQINSAVYYLDYKDKQQSVFIPEAFSFSFQNAASISSVGAEADIVALPSDWLTLQFAVGWNDGEYDSFPNCGGLGINCGGNELSEPSLTLSGSIEGLWPVSEGINLLMRFDARYEDEFYTDSQNTLEADDRTLVNGRLALKQAAGKWEVALWSSNLFDEEFFSPQPHPFFPGPLVSNIFPPRAYGLEVNLSF